MVIEKRKEVVYISGSLRSNQWPVIRTTAYLAYEEHPEGIVLDFSRVLAVSEKGEITFLAAAEEIVRCNLPFHLRQVPARVRTLVSPCAGDHQQEERCTLSQSSEVALDSWWNQIWGNA